MSKNIQLDEVWLEKAILQYHKTEGTFADQIAAAIRTYLTGDQPVDNEARVTEAVK